ncbi:AMP-binding protein, partial [Limosilactobacillus equigenerosi]
HQTFLGQPPYSFDLSGMFWLPALLSAGTIKAIPSAVVQNFGQLFQVVPNLDLNVFVSTPSFADMLMLSPEFNTEHMPGLNYFLFCGEELTVSTAKRLQERFPTAHIFNTYGPTEATVAVTSIEISQEMIETLKRLPVGKVKAHTTTSIWDDDQMLTEPNQQGEIIIAGDSVAKGYLNNPEKTAQNFFELNGQRAYRTGDAGMIDENGLHYVLGRMDFQIKLHGFRIELDEVRSSLETSPLIKQAVAVPKYDQDHKVKQLIAYIIPEASVTSEGTDFAKEMRQSLTGNIMDYMMPNQFIKVSEFPMSPNGKIAIKQMIAEANQS